MKIAACFGHGPDPVAAVRRMLSAQSLRSNHEEHVVDVGPGAIGYLATSDRSSKIRVVRQAEAGNLLLVSGVPVAPAADVDAVLDRAVRADAVTAAHLLSSLDGAFAALFWDAVSEKLAVVNDFLGMQPLYELKTARGLVVGTDLKALAAVHEGPVELDPVGWGALIGIGHFIGQNTSIAGVRRAPPARILLFAPATGERTIDHYWAPPVERPELDLAAVDTGCLAQLFRDSVVAYAAHRQGGTVLLSGGFDSRLVLCALVDAGIACDTLTMSRPIEHDDADARLAARLAARLGVAHRVVPADPGFFASSAFVDYLIANEVTTPSYGLFIPQVSPHVEPAMGAIWEGVGPGYTLKYPVTTGRSFAEFLSEHGHEAGSRWWHAAARVFAGPVSDEMETSFHDAWEQERVRHTDDASGVARFLQANRMPNRVGPNPLKVYANDVLPCTPGLTRSFWSEAAQIPPGTKADDRLYLEVFRRHFPSGTRVPFMTGNHLIRPHHSADLMFILDWARGRVVSMPYVGGLLRRSGLRPRLVSHASAVVDRTIAGVEAGHPDLNSDGVRELQKTTDFRDPVSRTAREWLFYWQMWRWIMDGSIHERRQALEASS